MYYSVNFEKNFRTSSLLDFDKVTNPTNNSVCITENFLNSEMLNGRRFFNLPSQ